jgi:hypothetical protein
MDSTLLNLEHASDAWVWLKALLAAYASAPTLHDLVELGAMQGVLDTYAKAPAEAREKIDVAFNKARARLKGEPVDKAPAQANPKTEPPRQPAAEFEAILIDASGEPGDALYSHPREFMEAFITLWRGAHSPEEQEALKEYNADALEASRPDAADILDQMMVKQNVLPPEVAVEPPIERGKISWPAYTKLIRHVLTTLEKRQFEEWTTAQRATIEKAPLSQRVLVVRAIAETAGAMDITPPQWLGDLMRKPVSQNPAQDEAPETQAEPVSDTDERWVNARIAELGGMTDRVEFDQLIGSLAVRTTMARLRRDKPELFARADAAFTKKHQALPQQDQGAA